MAGNPWLAHLKAFWSKNKGKMSYKAAMVAAKKTYKKKGAKAAPKGKKKSSRKRVKADRRVLEV